MAGSAGVVALLLLAVPASRAAAYSPPAASIAAASDTPTATIGPSPSAEPTPSAEATPSAEPTPSATPAPTHSTVQVLRVPSNDSGRSSRTIVVYRPAAPDSVDLPVLYLLHGQYGTPNEPFDAGMQSALDHLFAAGVPPFVVAVPDGISNARSDDEWGDAVDGADLLESFVTRDAISAVEGSLTRDRAHRAIAGFSMGGYGAAVDAARRSPLFGQYVSLAGYFHLDDPQHVFGSNATVRYVHTPIARTPLYDHTRVLLLDCSRENDHVILGELGRMRAALARRGHAPGAAITSGDHNWSWVNAQWPLVSRFLSQGWGRTV